MVWSHLVLWIAPFIRYDATISSRHDDFVDGHLQRFNVAAAL